MKPIIIYSDRTLNLLGIFFRIAGITLWPFIILRERYNSSNYWKNKAKEIINHESIHIKQQGEMLIIPFYLLYGLSYLWNIIKYRDVKVAYRNIPFEKEAFANEKNYEYLTTRRFWAWTKYF